MGRQFKIGWSAGLLLPLGLLSMGCPGGSSSGGGPVATSVTSGPSKVSSVTELSDTPANRVTLATWAETTTADPSIRYAALRRLEQYDTDAAVSIAAGLTGDSDAFVRTNAIGVLARANTPAADAAIATLPAADQELAQRIGGAK